MMMTAHFSEEYYKSQNHKWTTGRRKLLCLGTDTEPDEVRGTRRSLIASLFPSVSGTGEATSQVLCSVLGPSIQERHWGPITCPEKGNKTGEGSGPQISWGPAEGAGIVQSGEEEAQRRPHCTLQLPEGRLWWGGVWPFLPGNKQNPRKWPQVVPEEI